jgi:hypothetical protein
MEENQIPEEPNTLEEYFEEILQFRQACKDRGYHRINSEPEDLTKLVACYDCGLNFNKGFAKKDNIQYRVEPLSH